MKSSGSESDFGDYLSNLRKKTIGTKADIHIDGLSDFSFSELSEKKEKTAVTKSKFLKNKPFQNLTSSEISVSKEKKLKKKKDKKKKLKNVKNKENLVKDNNAIEYQTNVSEESDFKLSSNSYKVPKLQLSKRKSNLSAKSDDNDESSFGKDGNRFLKSKNKIQIPDVVDTIRNVGTDDYSSSRDISSPRKSTLRNVHSSTNKKKVTILENKQHNSLSSFDLETQNSIEEIPKSRSDSSSDFDKNFGGLKIMSFNELVGGDTDRSIVEENDTEHGFSTKFEKLVYIEELDNDFKSEPKHFSKTRNLHNTSDSVDSLSEIKTVPSATPRKSINSSRNPSVSEVFSISQRDHLGNHSRNSKGYSFEFEESIQEEIETATSATKKKVRKSSSYSSDFTDEDGTLRSVSKHHSNKEAHDKPIKPERPKTNNYPKLPPGLGREKVDPVPIAQYVVSPEALESLTAYSPSMLLMTNMIRQQIQMTTNFMETQKRLYESLMSSLQPTYQYSSLKEIKEFININKTKPLSMKKALRLVENKG